MHNVEFEFRTIFLFTLGLTFRHQVAGQGLHLLILESHPLFISSKLRGGRRGSEVLPGAVSPRQMSDPLPGTRLRVFARVLRVHL